ncbi:hypothetical protein AX16_010586 [Volvariella volvacea WC 439]|nr:hypothetical protein AX16_010586 [Volvariella volvacea WC 439]
MPWLIHLTRTVHFQCQVKAPPTAVIAYIQGPSLFLKLNSIVLSVEKHPRVESRYVVADRLPILGSVETTTTYEVTLTKQEKGVIGDVDAGVGTKLRNNWTVIECEDGTCLVKEEVKVVALFFFMPFILSTLNKPHQQNMITLVERVEALEIQRTSAPVEVATQKL